MANVIMNNTQKRVMSRIIAAPTGTVAYEQTQSNPNLVAARNQLAKLGLITIEGDSVTATETGLAAANQENLIDDTGSLTDVGQQFATSDPQDKPDQAEAQNESVRFRTLKMLLNQ